MNSKTRPNGRYGRPTDQAHKLKWRAHCVLSIWMGKSDMFSVHFSSIHGEQLAHWHAHYNQLNARNAKANCHSLRFYFLTLFLCRTSCRHKCVQLLIWLRHTRNKRIANRAHRSRCMVRCTQYEIRMQCTCIWIDFLAFLHRCRSARWAVAFVVVSNWDYVSQPTVYADR